MVERILVIDDDENLLKSIKKVLRLEQYSVDTLINAQQVEQWLDNQNYQSLLLDVKMPVINGLEVLKKVMQKYPALPVIMISGQSNIEIAVNTIKQGAYDFIEKPINPERLCVTVKNAIQRYHLQTTSDSIFNELQEKYRIIGKSPAIVEIFNQIEKVSNTPAKVVIQGESGTGKELVAWAIHYNSNRSGNPYIKLNCAALPSELLESELFGHKKGSFTGAIADHKGKFITADGGSLFLDEIGDMNIQLQAKLLRALEENEIEIIGDNVPKKVDVRVIAATNQNLEKLVENGMFRKDLYHRLNVVKIVIPPLRERVEDILPLAYHFLNQLNSSYNKQVLSINRQAEALLLNHSWPGNVRELRNVLEKTVVFIDKKEICIEDIQKALGADLSYHAQLPVLNNDILPLKEAGNDFEKKYILIALNKFDWKISQTAKALKIDRSNLFKKMRKYGIRK